MSNRCPSCNKFAALDLIGPDYDATVEFDGETASVSLSISRSTECCGEEVQALTVDIDGEVDPEILDAHSGHGHSLITLDNMPYALENRHSRGTNIEVGMTVCVYCTCQASTAEIEDRMVDPLQELHLEELIEASMMEAA